MIELYKGLLAKIQFVFDLFHILLKRFLRILKRKLKENHFCFIEKIIVQSVVLIIKKENNKNKKQNEKKKKLIAILRKANTQKTFD